MDERTWPRLLEVVDRIQGVSILVVGDFMLDRYVYGDAQRISPEAPVPVLRVVRRDDALGGAGSVAADLAAMGAVPHCVGIVGEDEQAGVVRRLLASAQAEASGLIGDPSRPTTRKMRLIGLAQHRHRQQLMRIDDESEAPISDALRDAMLKRIESQLPACRAVCIEDYGKGVVTPALVQGVIRLAAAQNVPVLVDPAPISDYRLYHGATILTPNRTEAGRVVGRELPSIDAVRAASSDLVRACGTKYVCVTLDAEGAALVHADGRCEHFPTKARDVYDVTGAGDAVLAALAGALAAGASVQEAVMLANVAGGLEVEKFGCVPVSRAEIVGEILLDHHREAGKVRPLEEVLAVLTRRRARGATVAFTNGCFDLLHVGHARSFAFCKQHADVLVVGLNSDDSVRRQNKGLDRPLVGQEDRAALLAAFEDVDHVVIFDEDAPDRLIEAIRPDRLIKGDDWAGKDVAGRSFVESYGGQVLLAPLVEGRSTTGLIERIRAGRAS